MLQHRIKRFDAVVLTNGGRHEEEGADDDDR